MSQSRTNEFTKAFLKDDYERISIKYFQSLRESNQIFADPSFWYQMNPLTLSDEEKYIGKYQSDYRGALNCEKAVLSNLITAWDKTSYELDEVTLCASATSASSIVLASFQQMGIKTVYFETPAYFASLDQCTALGIEALPIPTYREQSFALNTDLISETRPKTVWITQPRFALGSNQSKDRVLSILSKLSEKDFLVIDEATEQYFPSVLGDINMRKYPNVIKLRSFFKPMGINGPRMSFILHRANLKRLFENQMEIFQGAIDVFSLRYTVDFAQDPHRFKTMLEQANRQVRGLMNRVNTFCLNSSLSPNQLVNGYIGSVGIELPDTSIPYLKRRELLLKHCQKYRVPVILGATMRFAVEDSTEFVRINYFNEESEVINGLKVLSSFSL